MSDQLTPSDLSLIRNALQARREAEATFRFVSAHIETMYAITQGVTYRLDTGEITRPAPNEGLPPKP